MTPVVSCRDCAYWDGHARQDGACRRRAARPTEAADQIAHWPMTGALDGCGDGVARSPSPVASPTCGTCRYWRTHAGGLEPQDRRDERKAWWRSAGHCLRHAPAPSSDPGLRGFWRATHTSDGCAEGEAADPKI